MGSLPGKGIEIRFAHQTKKRSNKRKIQQPVLLSLIVLHCLLSPVFIAVLSTMTDSKKEEPSWRTLMEAYKGGPEVPPTTVLGGLVSGALGTYLTYQVFPACTGTSPMLLLQKSMVLPAAMFFTETHLGVVLRQTLSAKASFNPAGTQAAGLTPYEIIEGNRIHQNHIEAFMYFFPAVLALTGYTEETPSLIPTIVINWTLGRILYRLGYKAKNKHNRLFGMAYSMAACLPAIPYGLYRFMTDVIFAERNI